jgi:hypothetical protein
MTSVFVASQSRCIILLSRGEIRMVETWRAKQIYFSGKSVRNINNHLKFDFILFYIVQQQLKGEAEAFAIEAKGKAEAEQMVKKADAWKEYQDAAIVDMFLQTLPKVGNMEHNGVPEGLCI